MAAFLCLFKVATLLLQPTTQRPLTDALVTPRRLQVCSVKVPDSWRLRMTEISSKYCTSSHRLVCFQVDDGDFFGEQRLGGQLAAQSSTPTSESCRVCGSGLGDVLCEHSDVTSSPSHVATWRYGTLRERHEERYENHPPLARGGEQIVRYSSCQCVRYCLACCLGSITCGIKRTRLRCPGKRRRDTAWAYLGFR